jgi:membrane dipeptidase
MTDTVHKKPLLLSLGLLFLMSPDGFAEVITISGSVKDQGTFAPIDSALVEIVNSKNPAERYSVVTNTAGLWSYTFNTTGVLENPALPGSFSVDQNYPNPFNPSTTIPLSTRIAGVVRIAVYNAVGQLMDARTFSVPAGNHAINWTSKGAAGMLFYSIEFGGAKTTRKMIQLDGGGQGGLGEVTTYGGRTTMMDLQKVVTDPYHIVTSKLIYMPDTVTTILTNGASVDVRLETVHHRAFVFDLHNDVMEKVVFGYQMGIRHTTDQSDLPRFRDGGVDAQMFAVWTDWRDSVAHPYYDFTLAMVDSFNSQIRQNSADFGQARTSEEILEANAAGKLAGVLAVEGGHAIENDLAKLRTFYEKGARYLTITWNNSLPWAVSAADARSTTVGLSDFGRQVIRTMDSLGMIIDVAHTGIKTIWDILATTKNPIVATHSGVRALNNHTRNLTDAQIDSIAKRGGVIGVVFYPPFLSPRASATIDTVIRHIDYIKNRVGIDYVAIGSDFDGIESVPVGLEDVAKLPNLTAALLKRGYSIADVRKILGENYLRVFRQICK